MCTMHTLVHAQKQNNNLSLRLCFFDEYFTEYIFRIHFAITLKDIQVLWFYFISQPLINV